MSDDLIKRSDALSAAGDMSYIAFEIRRKLRMIPSAEPMPDYIDNILVARHYCNGMVTMNEECYKRLQTRGESKSGEADRPQGENLSEEYPSLFECSVCGASCFDTIPWDCNINFCPNCGAKMKGADDESK